jgi:sterol desaturase/sphingolipid hydroxylase (fatty acid hydroxylase superfamily)
MNFHLAMLADIPAVFWGARFTMQCVLSMRDLAQWVAPIVVLEILLPKRDLVAPSLASRVRAVAIWMSAAPISVLIGNLTFVARTALHARPLLETAALPLPQFVKVGLAWLLAWFVGDFVYYWYHRAAHKWFWPLHGTHHSIRELSALTAYAHPLEWLLIIFLYSIPVAFLVTDPYSPMLMGTAFGYYLHAQTKFNFGPLGYIIQDNRYHRVHHSIRREHWNKNFCVFVTVWDVLFGTACFDGMKEWPEVGVEGQNEIDSIPAFWLRPLRWCREARAQGRYTRVSSR